MKRIPAISVKRAFLNKGKNRLCLPKCRSEFRMSNGDEFPPLFKGMNVADILLTIIAVIYDYQEIISIFYLVKIKRLGLYSEYVSISFPDICRPSGTSLDMARNLTCPKGMHNLSTTAFLSSERLRIVELMNIFLSHSFADIIFLLYILGKLSTCTIEIAIHGVPSRKICRFIRKILRFTPKKLLNAVKIYFGSILFMNNEVDCFVRIAIAKTAFFQCP